MNTRIILPCRRDNETFDVEHDGTFYQVTVGFFADNPAKPAEIFIDGAQPGSELEAVLHDSAIMLSVSLQCGLSLDMAIDHQRDDIFTQIINRVSDRLKHSQPPA
jgi:hypothetical protein